MKKLILLFPLLLALIVPNCADAQRLIGKELKSEDPSLNNDDKVYQWVRYTYVMGTDTLDAAFDINGKRITPNGYRPKKGRDKGVHYCGGGVFEVNSKKNGKYGRVIVSGYDTDGKCIFPLTLTELLDCVWIYHIGYGLFELQTFVGEKQSVFSLYNKKGECLIPKENGICLSRVTGEADLKYVICTTEKNSSGKEIDAAYDLDGKVVIPKSLGYTWIHYSEGYWHCEDASRKDVTYSKDLKYVADGYYSNNRASEFNQKKRSNPNYNGPYNFNPNYRPSSNSYTPQQPQTQQPQQKSTQIDVLYSACYDENMKPLPKGKGDSPIEYIARFIFNADQIVIKVVKVERALNSKETIITETKFDPKKCNYKELGNEIEISDVLTDLTVNPSKNIIVLRNRYENVLLSGYAFGPLDDEKLEFLIMLNEYTSATELALEEQYNGNLSKKVKEVVSHLKKYSYKNR